MPAAKAAELGAWLRSLAHAEAGEAAAAAPAAARAHRRQGAAWWRGLFEPGRDRGRGARARLLGRGAPLTVDALSDPDERHAVFAAAYARRRRSAAPARSAWLDQALVEASLGGEPLFLAMFGLVAAQQGLTAAKALEADQIALKLAQQELERIGRHWAASGLHRRRRAPAARASRRRGEPQRRA